MASKKKLFVTIGIVFWTFTLVFAVLPFWPHLYYRLSPQTSNLLASTIASTAVAAQSSITSPTPTPSPSEIRDLKSEIDLPDVDPSLPAENGLIIDKIGVRGEIHEGTDVQNILRKGIWRVPDFGTPPESGRPIIIAAHRWGYLEWSASFRKLNSFYNLPQLKADDTVTVIWQQRQYDYKVYATSTGNEITDYGADLILYTCQLWNSPVRYFVYANRIN